MTNGQSILIFGAGKIGRSFIGQLFGCSGYEVVFSDIDHKLIDEINRRRSYSVIIKSNVREETIVVPNVRAVFGSEENVAVEVAKANIMAISVGKNVLVKIIPLIAKGLLKRYAEDPSMNVDIIIAENMRSAAAFMRKEFSKHLPQNYPLDKIVGLVETSIGKMVPIMTLDDSRKDPLTIFAEPYNQLIVDKNGFRNAIPDVPTLAPKENIAAWVDRKAFIHNLGHATAAYYGHFLHPEAIYMYQVLDDPNVYAFTRSVMQQSAEILRTLYPADFTKEGLELHIDELLARFRNTALKDTVFRVGQDRMRKLAPDDRFVGIIRQAQKLQLDFDLILQALAFAFFFKAKDHSGECSDADIHFDNLAKTDIKTALECVCGFDKSKDTDLVLKVKKVIEFNKKHSMTNRTGIISVGNWLVDKLKFIEKYPVPGNLTSIVREETGLGGCSHNVLVDLAKMKTGLPLYAGGCVGKDANGDYIMNEIRKNNLDFRYMNVINGIPTSYTDVMIPLDGTSRTFFHNKGANACLDFEHIENIDISAKIFHLGYLLLLDKLDTENDDYGIEAAKVLHHLQQKGYKTSVDVVSEEGDRFKKIIFPCLPYIDYLIVNEIEAGECYGKSLRDESGEIKLDDVKYALHFLLDKGVNQICVIHFPEGGYAMKKNGELHYEPSIRLSFDEIVSPVGAGDAFCAGMLYMLHEGKSLKEALVFANTSARFNLKHTTSTGGAPTLEEINDFIKRNYPQLQALDN